MSLKKLLLFVLFFFHSVVFAEWKIIGFESIINSAWFIQSPHTFENSFVCKSQQSYTYNTQKCEYKCSGHCETKCSTFNNPTSSVYNFIIDECTSESVGIFGDGMNLFVSKSDYEKSQNTWFLEVIKNIGNYIQPEGSLRFDNVFPKTIKKINDYGDIETVTILEISFTIQFFANTSMIHGAIGIDPNQKGLQQLIYLTEGNKNVFIQQLSYFFP